MFSGANTGGTIMLACFNVNTLTKKGKGEKRSTAKRRKRTEGIQFAQGLNLALRGRSYGLMGTPFVLRGPPFLKWSRFSHVAVGVDLLVGSEEQDLI